MSNTILLKRGTRSQIEAAKALNQLKAGEPYLITDEARIAVGSSTNGYSSFAKDGANTDITSLSGIDYVQFDLGAAIASSEGKLAWNATDGTLEFGLKGGNVTLQIGQEEVVRVTNTSGSPMLDGQAVYITGSTGIHLNVALAQANGEATSSKTIAIVTETIASSNSGFATSRGLVRNINTSGLTEGGAVWLSPTIPGGLTSIKPTAPNHAVLIGWCVRSHASVGSIFVSISNGWELEELHNVNISGTLTNNSILVYNANNLMWENRSALPVQGGGTGGSSFTGYIKGTGQDAFSATIGIPATDITGPLDCGTFE